MGAGGGAGAERPHDRGVSDLLRVAVDLADDQVRLLMAEYDHLTGSFRSNEESGERRMNVLLGMIGAVTAAVGLAADRFTTDAGLASAIAVASFALLTFGLVTLRRLMERNLATTSYLNGLRRIRAFFIWRQRELVEVLPFVPHGEPHVREREKLRGIGKAGYLEVAAVVNCLLAAVGSGAAMSQTLPAVWTALSAVAMGGSAWFLQMWWARETYASATQRTNEARDRALGWWATVSHPGAPTGHEVEEGEEGREVFRAGVGLVVADGRGRVLSMERSDVPSAWQLPQGGLLPRETPEAAAWRELREETGLGEEHLTLEATSPTWIGYELPEEMRNAKTGRGQVHRWYLFRMRPGVEPPEPPGQGSDEFRARRWVRPAEVAADAIAFRRPVYETVIGWFSAHLGERPHG